LVFVGVKPKTPIELSGPDALPNKPVECKAPPTFARRPTPELPLQSILILAPVGFKPEDKTPNELT
jgi:hypothetical protein